MVHNAALGTQLFSDVQIIDRTHPAIIRGAAFRQDGRVHPRGTVVATDSNGAMAAFEPGLATAADWEAETVYAAGALIKPTTPNGHYYRCTTGGTSHTAEPTWPTAVGGAVDDATAAWAEAGLLGVDVLTGGGVLTEAIDTAVEAVGPVLKHGTVVKDNLKVVGAAAAAADIAALEAIGIFPV